MKNNYTPPVASEEEFITPLTPEEEAALEEMYKPRLPFWQKLVIYITVWIAVIFGACCVMWNIMNQYEAAQPWYAVEKYIATSGQTAFYNALTNSYGSKINEHESLYDIASTISRQYTGKLSYKKLIREYTYENPVYLLHSGDKNLLKLTLRPGEPTGFMGLKGYSVRSIELVASDIISLNNYALVFPTGADVKINGSTYEPKETNRYAVFGSEDFTVCMLENLSTRPTVEVTLDDIKLTANEGEHFIFDYPTPRLKTVTVTAPADAHVFINGTHLKEEFVTETVESKPDRFGYSIPLVKYTVPTVAGSVDVTASANGNKLLPSVSGSDYAFAAATSTCRVVLPEGAVLYANDSAIDSSESAGETVWRGDFDGVRNAPTAAEYIYTGLYNTPEFTATLNGVELARVDDEDKSVFLMPASDELKETYSGKAIAFMNAYLYYTTQGYSKTRENLNAVKALVASPSPLYTNLERSYIGYYYIAPQQMKVDYMEVENFIPYGENFFTCELSYKISLSNWVGETVDENTMRLAFAKHGDEFLPVNMRLASE